MYLRFQYWFVCVMSVFSISLQGILRSLPISNTTSLQLKVIFFHFTAISASVSFPLECRFNAPCRCRPGKTRRYSRSVLKGQIQSRLNVFSHQHLVVSGHDDSFICPCLEIAVSEMSASIPINGCQMFQWRYTTALFGHFVCISHIFAVGLRLKKCCFCLKSVQDCIYLVVQISAGNAERLLNLSTAVPDWNSLHGYRKSTIVVFEHGRSFLMFTLYNSIHIKNNLISKVH